MFVSLDLGGVDAPARYQRGVSFLSKRLPCCEVFQRVLTAVCFAGRLLAPASDNSTPKRSASIRNFSRDFATQPTGKKTNTGIYINMSLLLIPHT